MHIRWTFFLSFIAILVSVWSYRLNHEQEPQSILLAEKGKGQTLPTYVGVNMSTVTFGKNGQIQYEVTATKVSHFEQSGLTYFQMPNFILFDEKNHHAEKAWQVTANNAILHKKDTLQLEKDVLIKNLQQSSPVEGLETAEAWVNLHSMDTYSHFPTIIFGSQVNAKGQQFSGNLKQKLFTLENQVNTHYEIEPK